MSSKRLILIMSLLFSTGQANAIEFKDSSLQEGESIRLVDIFEDSEIHADGSINNFWVLGEKFVDQNHTALFDYRFESHTSLYNLNSNSGKIVTRVEGFSAIDEDIQDFFEDKLIDIPELFYQNTTDLSSNKVDFVFGKFANRRFFDKDEITPDPFDIGERPYSQAFTNTNLLLNGVNQLRNDNPSLLPSATGSYGFMFSIKDKEGSKFTDRWGFKQAFAVAQLDDFSNNFYGLSELNKNWGKDRPGQFNLGLLYGQSDVFTQKVRLSVFDPVTRSIRTLSNENKETYIFYTSVVQKITDKLSSYFRYGLLNANGGSDFTISNYNTGLFYELTAKDRLETHFIYTNFHNIDLNPITHVLAWTHRFSDDFYSTLYGNFNYKQIFDDENATLGVNLTFAI